MKLVVERYLHKPDWTISHLYKDGVLQCYGIEDESRAVKVKGETCIPVGVYELGFRQSPKFSNAFLYNPFTGNICSHDSFSNNPKNYKDYTQAHPLIWIKGVPGFEYVLLHWGNTDDDTDGCYIVGNQLGIVKNQQAVLNSRLTYLSIYPEIMKGIKAGGATIEYKNL